MNKNATREKEPETMDEPSQTLLDPGPMSQAPKPDKNLRKSASSRVWIFGKAKCSKILPTFEHPMENFDNQ